MFARIAALILAILLAGALIAPAAAQDFAGEGEARAYASEDGAQVWVITIWEADSPAQVYAAASFIDRYWLEAHSGGTVVDEVGMSAYHATDWGLSSGRISGRIYGVVHDINRVVIVGFSGATVYIFELIGNDIEGELAVEYIKAVTAQGHEAGIPAGFVEVPLSDQFSLF